ncbi:MAG: hypothetical protein IKU29_11800 [Parabacteroides sp.]|nr:hypothetical protein [Parabacteroides sp.]
MTEIRGEEVNNDKPRFKEFICDSESKIILNKSLKADINGDVITITKKHCVPNNYHEACEILRANSERSLIEIDRFSRYLNDYEDKLVTELTYLSELLICLDACWVLCDNWSPDHHQDIYSIYTDSVRELTRGKGCATNHLLSFPTAQVRDEFYNNFEDLIKKCIRFV